MHVWFISENFEYFLKRLNHQKIAKNTNKVSIGCFKRGMRSFSPQKPPKEWKLASAPAGSAFTGTPELIFVRPVINKNVTK